MTTYIKTFLADEDGAITVDWVTLTAAVVVLGLAVLATIQAGAVGAITQMWADVAAAI